MNCLIQLNTSAKLPNGQLMKFDETIHLPLIKTKKITRFIDLPTVVIDQNINNSRNIGSGPDDTDVYVHYPDSDENIQNLTEKVRNDFSKIYVCDIYHSKRLYLLKFKATDTRMESLYLAHRVFEETPNDKCLQPRSKSSYQNIFNAHSYKMNVMKKKFHLKKNDDRISVMSMKKPLMSSKISPEAPPGRKRTISSPTTNVQRSFIMLMCKGMYFELYPGIIDLRSCRLIDDTVQENGETIEKMRNRAHVIVRYKKDVLKFIFTLSEVQFEPVKQTRSLGIQAQDDKLYIRGFSDITNRKVHIQIPKSTFFYKDPLVKIKRDGNRLKLNNQEPRWLSETRKQRLHEYRKCRVHDPYRDIMGLKIGSSINFDSNNVMNKTKFDTAECLVDEDQYENWVIEQQKAQYQESNKYKGIKINEDRNDELESQFEGNNKTEATSDEGIPDWDYVIYNQ